MSKDKNTPVVATLANARFATTGCGGRFSAHRKTQAVHGHSFAKNKLKIVSLLGGESSCPVKTAILS